MVGLASFVGVSSAAFAITQRTDASMQTLERNRYLLAGVAAVAGVYVAIKKSVPFGVALAGGALTSALGLKAVVEVQKLIDAPKTTVGAVYGDMGAYAAQMGAYAPQMGALGAVYGDMGAVYGDMGAFAPAPPWTGNPF